MYSYSKPIPWMSAIRSQRFVALLCDYEGELVRAGYNPQVTRLHLRSVAHFGIWLEREGLDIEKTDEGTVAAFARHRARCRCPRHHTTTPATLSRAFGSLCVISANAVASQPQRHCRNHLLSLVNSFSG